jgi:hypothetical protein
MKNQHASISKGLSILFIFTLLLVSLIPVIFIWGKPIRANNSNKKEASLILAIYADEDCTIKIQSISWGELVPGGNSTVVVYIKNRSKVPVTLNCSLSNFSPEDDVDYLTLVWDREAYLLEAHKIVKARMFLSVSESMHFNMFNVDIVFTGTA